MVGEPDLLGPKFIWRRSCSRRKYRAKLLVRGGTKISMPNFFRG